MRLSDIRFIVLVCIVGLYGCGGAATNAPYRYKVTGSVSLDGKPLESGQIAFIPSDGQGVPDAGTIKGGNFSFDASAGTKRIEIRSEMLTGKKGPYGEDVKEEAIPAKYNVNTELKADVKSDGANTFDFSLETE